MSPKGVHGPTYNSWIAMKTRCYNPMHENYNNYGGRGIQVCEEWRLNYRQFLADMGEKPEGTSLDREKNDLDYDKNNCKWSTRAVQNRNTSKTIHVTWEGKTQCLKDLCIELGLKYHTVRRRLKVQQLSLEEALRKEYQPSGLRPATLGNQLAKRKE